jgi:hypothetical protein
MNGREELIMQQLSANWELKKRSQKKINKFNKFLFILRPPKRRKPNKINQKMTTRFDS